MQETGVRTQSSVACGKFTQEFHVHAGMLEELRVSSKNSGKGENNASALILTTDALPPVETCAFPQNCQYDRFLETLWPTQSFSCSIGEGYKHYSQIIRCVALPSPRLPRRSLISDTVDYDRSDLDGKRTRPQ